MYVVGISVVDLGPFIWFLLLDPVSSGSGSLWIRLILLDPVPSPGSGSFFWIRFLLLDPVRSPGSVIGRNRFGLTKIFLTRFLLFSETLLHFTLYSYKYFNL